MHTAFHHHPWRTYCKSLGISYIYLYCCFTEINIIPYECQKHNIVLIPLKNVNLLSIRKILRIYIYTITIQLEENI